MKEFQVNSTTYVMQIFMADSTDGKTGLTGLTVTVELSKNGGAFAAAAGAVTEIGYGWYALAGNATDRDTLGKLALHATATGADASDAEYDIVSYDPYTYGGNLDDTISSRMAAASYVAPDNATIGAIDAAVTALAADVGDIPADVWAETPRTLTTPVGAVSPTVTGMDVTVQRGDTWSASLTGLGNLAGRSKLWVTAKSSTTEADSQAMWQIEETGGLLVLNRAPAVAPAATSTDGSLTVNDEAAGDITVMLKPDASKVLPAGTWFIDIQVLYTSGVVQTLAAGTWTSVGDVTRSVA